MKVQFIAISLKVIFHITQILRSVTRGSSDSDLSGEMLIAYKSVITLRQMIAHGIPLYPAKYFNPSLKNIPHLKLKTFNRPFPSYPLSLF